MAFTDKEHLWLASILKERVSKDLYLDREKETSSDEPRIYIKYGHEALYIDGGEFQKLASDMLCQAAEEITLTDVFGLIFKSLTCQEEYKQIHLDEHDRFSASSSTAYQSGTLECPVVDMCFDIIRQSVSRQWPELKLREFSPKTFVTCDVDNPYEYYTSSYRALIKKLGGDLLKRRSLDEFNRSWMNYLKTARGDYSLDSNDTFEWMMEVNEKAGNRMAFYFLVDVSVPAMDAHYSIDEPRIRDLMRNIHARGHEIGLHASYGTFKDPQQMKKEADKLRQVMDEEGIRQDEIGSRQHYLRWSTPETARHLEAAGIAYDTTLGYAEQPGFRCGTSHEFQMFDIEKQEASKLRQRPLIVMEASVLSPKYMNRDYSEDTFEYMKSIKDECFNYGGNFTLLWHNSSLKTEEDKVLYQEIINA
jgi:hypothetical protein